MQSHDKGNIIVEMGLIRKDFPVEAYQGQQTVNQASCFYEKSFIETKSCPFIYVLSTSVFILQGQRGVVVTKTVWPGKTELFAIYFTEQICRPLVYVIDK